MERKQIYIAQEQETELKRLSKAKGVSVSYMIREAVALYIADEAKPLPQTPEAHPLWDIVGIADSAGAPSDGSVNHDAVLYSPTRRRRSR